MIFSLLAKFDSVTGNEIPEISILDALIYALVGFAVTFLGICILIFFVWAAGKLIKQIQTKKNAIPENDQKQASASGITEESGDAEEVRVAIIAAIAAYYAAENSSCEFKVKRIKRL